jgi:RNA recognition motif-containing protein
MDIYVGNLPYNTTDADLSEMFGEYGNVSSAKIIIDRDSQRSKGFAFVSMPDDNEARSAIEALDGSDMGGRSLKVNQARPRESSGGGDRGGDRGDRGDRGGDRGGPRGRR